jgi:hypothetical protein
MKTPKSLRFACATVCLVFAACAGGEQAPSSSPDAVAAGLACGELEQGGAARPFVDGAPGVEKTSLRAEDLPTYDVRDADLDANARVGVRYSVAASPGSSKAWLERQIHCYRAARAGMAGADPLLVADARIAVSTVAGRYLVDVTSTDRETAREVLRAAGL